MDSENRVPGEIVWSDALPKRKVPFVPILTPAPARPVKGIIVTNRYEGCPTHWTGGRTRPHIHPVSQCASCGFRDPIRQRYYAAVYLFDVGRYALLEFTPGALEGNPALSAQQGRLRNLQLTLKRQGQSRQSRVAAILETPLLRVELPPPLDIRQALHVIWYGGGEGNQA